MAVTNAHRARTSTADVMSVAQTALQVSQCYQAGDSSYTQEHRLYKLPPT